MQAASPNHQATYPERSFLRSALDEMKAQIVADMQAAVRSAIEK
jgi:hypothetical protein